MKALSTSGFILSLFFFLAIPGSISLAQPITSSGLNTTVSAPITLPSGQTQFNITGGTRPGGGANLFHSFGDFNVPNNNIANFLNNSGLATSNILGRVTGGNPSNIFGSIQTTGFGNANLFLMNPAGFLFGPNATVNVGGMMTFTSADYLRLTDGARFNAIPHTAPDLLLSAAPVAAFGFLGANPGAITVQGSHLSVADGTGISLVGGNITMQAGTLDNGTVQSAQLSAPSGQINVVSVGKPSKGGGEVVIAGSGSGSGFTPTGFETMGAITLSQGSTVDTSPIADSGHSAGNIVIRGGQFVMDDSSIESVISSIVQGGSGASGNIEVTAEQVAITNHSRIDTSVQNFINGGSTGNITFNVNTFSATDSGLSATSGSQTGGAVTTQGLQGSGSSAHEVSLTNTDISTVSSGLPREFEEHRYFCSLGIAVPTEQYQVVLQRHARQAEGKLFYFMHHDLLRRIGEYVTVKHWIGGAGTFGWISGFEDPNCRWTINTSSFLPPLQPGQETKSELRATGLQSCQVVFPLARLLPRRKPPQRVSFVSQPAVTRACLLGVGGCRETPPTLKLKALIPHYRR